MLDRRKFLLLLGAGAAGLVLLPKRKLASMPLLSPGRGTPKTKLTAASVQLSNNAEKNYLSIVRGKDPAAMTRKAIDLIGGMGSFVSKGDVVLVKPNIGWDRVPDQAANTNPEVVGAIVAMVLEAGAKKVLVADNPCNDPRRCYARSGIEEAAKKAGAEVRFIQDWEYVKKDLGGTVLRDWLVYNPALTADKIINVPIAKTHGTARLTLAMKNLMGVTGGARNLMHQRMFESVADLTAFFKPQLHVLDAIRILKANGPTGGSLADVAKPGLIAASADPVAIEAFGVTLFGMTPADLPEIEIGEKRGLGVSDYKAKGFAEINLG
jgi:uncharacterized protein (DUF362 family)